MDKIEELLKEQNGRIKTNEEDLVRFKTAVSSLNSETNIIYSFNTSL